MNQKRLFGNILESSRARLYRMAYAWTHDPALADDLVQQACYQALRKQKQLREFDAVEAWLFRILANCMADFGRSRREELRDEESTLVDSVTPESAATREQIAERVRQAIRELPLAHRQVVTLVDIEGFAYAAVAEILDLPVGTVMSRLSRGRRALRERLLERHAREDIISDSKLRRIK